MLNNIVRTRFAPSPTGLLHIGNARAALFSALFAKQAQGLFVLRIEDTDLARSSIQFVENLQDDLHWLEIFWQEGPGADGEHGPYWQSQRQAIYRHYYEQLVARNLTYPCFCTEEELALERKLLLARGMAPRYRGTCRNLSAEKIEEKLAQGLKPTLRFRVPTNKKIDFEDLIKGPQSFNSDDIGDFIIRRADGTSPFLFCNTIDDALMKVTHVLRGEDHVANTPRQLLIAQTLGLTAPHYGHMALIVGEDGTPLSKRHGSFSLTDLRQQGYLPMAIINHLARLGHTSEQLELMHFDDLAKSFHLKKISRSPARFDLNQLLHWQKLAVSALDTVSFWTWIGEAGKRVPEAQRIQFIEAVRPNICFPEDAAKWAEIFFGHHLEFTPESLQLLKHAGEQFFVEAEQAVDSCGDDFKRILQEVKQALQVSGKNLYQPIRLALTGQIDGPELAQIAAILGPKRMRERFSRAFQLVSRK